jgi:hypothetical protein
VRCFYFILIYSRLYKGTYIAKLAQFFLWYNDPKLYTYQKEHEKGKSKAPGWPKNTSETLVYSSTPRLQVADPRSSRRCQVNHFIRSPPSPLPPSSPFASSAGLANL